MKYVIEIATSDFTTTKAAVAGGADRIELCANLVEGGTTPSYGMIRQCREAFSVSLFPIIRPRGGDFLYTDDEYVTMLHDINICKQLQCDGIVTGLLQRDGDIDLKRMGKLIEAAHPMSVTFHRAFDRCSNPFEVLEELIQLGCDRILTSGQRPAAPDGVELIAELNRIGGHRIHIMPGSGVRADNIRMLAEKTGCTEFHSSLRGKEKSAMEFIHPAFEDSSESYMNNAIDPDAVRALREALEAVRA
ncbi:MAG TPA: copper homeostasis protein CutC [Chitinophagaceae bacterium]